MEYKACMLSENCRQHSCFALFGAHQCSVLCTAAITIMLHPLPNSHTTEVHTLVHNSASSQSHNAQLHMQACPHAHTCTGAHARTHTHTHTHTHTRRNTRAHARTHLVTAHLQDNSSILGHNAMDIEESQMVLKEDARRHTCMHSHTHTHTHTHTSLAFTEKRNFEQK